MVHRLVEIRKELNEIFRDYVVTPPVIEGERDTRVHQALAKRLYVLKKVFSASSSVIEDLFEEFPPEGEEIIGKF